MDGVEAVGSRTPLGTLTPSQQNSDGRETDFSKLTPSHFGISTDSFLTFSKEKDKSRVAQLKARRRSTIGLRGSPETNSLICFRAKAAMKTPPRTPQNILASPLFTGCDSIKQKMAAFQRLMGEDEENSEQSAPLMMKEEQGEGGMGGSLSKDVQTGNEVCSEERQDRITPSKRRPTATPPPSKKRRRVPLGLCEEEILEEPFSELQNTPTQEPGVRSSDFRSPELKLGLGSDSQSQLMSFPMLSKPEVIRTDDFEVSSVSKKKRVRFGAPLSPEFFDKTLPPSTPLQKGATPVRPPSSTGRKSLLKTPQRFDPPLPQPDFNSPGHNGASPVLSVSRRCRSREVESDEVFLDNEKITFPIMEDEFDNPPDDSKDADLAEGPELTLHLEPPAAGTELMNTGFREEEDLFPPFIADHSVALPAEVEAEPQPDLKQPESQQEQQPASPASTTEAPRSRGRKRKQPAQRENQTETKRSSRTAAASDKGKMKLPVEDVTEIRRSSRTAAESAKGKMKTTAAKKRFGSKEVDRSLYGKRNYASKNPLLSPIPESAASSLTNTPTHPHPDAKSDSSQTPAPNSHQRETDSTDATADLVAAAARWRQRFLQQPGKSGSATEVGHAIVEDDSASELEADPASADASVNTAAHTAGASSGTKARRTRRSSSRPAGRRRSGNTVRMKRLSGAHESETEGAVDEEQTRDTAGPLTESAIGDQMRQESTQSETLVRCESTQEEDNSHSALHQDKDEEPEPTAQRKQARKSPRVKSTAVTDVMEEEEPCQHPLETNQSGDERAEGEGGRELTESSLAVGDSEFSSVETLGGQNEPVLEPWQQANFNIEDILRPVVTRQRSVRRSLRNRRSMDVQASGLAWVDHTSPELITANRRRTRSRLSAVSQPPTFLDTEGAQANQGE
ncbi:cell division cycle-associated protein 2 [Pygocentrus nattereri]|uniref:PP1-binding domain-containing protein n=1 Tax=Pygocentrus nattereri TaxID=42514 RepID=A0A3B4DXJ9_PYGNA|nr:cell division cycle-associated protein 2 [Pygocentrus nattereri]XP_017573692.1 cell division cycle-associated protein 2 [Pygocentrus nattereri]